MQREVIPEDVHGRPRLKGDRDHSRAAADHACEFAERTASPEKVRALRRQMLLGLGGGNGGVAGNRLTP